MASEKERRFAVGTPDGRRSTVWKIWTQKSDVYILTRMFGADAKVSLHQSGECQWSCTDVWVKKESGRRNQQRHISQWNLPPQKTSEANHVFRIQIPESELRSLATNEKLGGVQWLPAPTAGMVLAVDCHLTPILNSDPTITSELPHALLRSFPLADGRWFVVLYHEDAVNSTELEVARKNVVDQNRTMGHELLPEHRIAMFGTYNKTGARTLIELCPFTE